MVSFVHWLERNNDYIQNKNNLISVNAFAISSECICWMRICKETCSSLELNEFGTPFDVCMSLSCTVSLWFPELKEKVGTVSDLSLLWGKQSSFQVMFLQWFSSSRFFYKRQWTLQSTDFLLYKILNIFYTVHAKW